MNAELPQDRQILLDAFTDYLRRRNHSPVTVRNRASYARRFMRDHDPASVEPFDIEEWVYSQGWQPESMNGAISGVRKFFLWMQASGRRDDNSASELKTVPIRRKRPRIADDAQIAAAMTRASLSTQVMLLLAAECGLRRAEIARAHRDDIEDQWLTVHGKGGRERVVFMPDHLVERIQRLPGRGWLFPSRLPSPERTHGTSAMYRAGCRDAAGCPGHPDSGISCQQASRDAEARHRRGIKQLRTDTTRHITPEAVYARLRHVIGNPHSLRHRAATAVYRGTGNDLRVTQEFLGHASPSMTARYVHVTDRDLRLASIAAQLDLAG